MAALLPLLATGGDGSSSLSSDVLWILPILARRVNWKNNIITIKYRVTIK
jgi:hypothetical protein